MFLRFVIGEIDPDSGHRTGVFQAAYTLSEGTELPGYDRRRLNRQLNWFADRLPAPDRLALSRRPQAKNIAIGWFKDSAVEHIARAHELSGFLTGHGRQVEVLRTRRPGYVVYEDEFQVAAFPFADTPT